MRDCIHREFYLPGATVPKVFRDMDKIMWEKYKDTPDPVLEHFDIPMPYIHGTPGVEGPFIVTKDWYVKQKEKVKVKREMEIEMMKLLAERDVVMAKLGELDPTDKHDSKKILNLNIRLKDINAELEMYQKQSGVNMTELEHGTRFDRFVGRIKRTVKKNVKKVKRFFKKYKEPLLGLVSVVAPLLIAVVAKGLIGAIAG